MTEAAVNFRDLGFLSAFPGREYHVRRHAEQIGPGQAQLQAVSIRTLNDDVVIEAANGQSLKLTPFYDPAHPDFALLETIGATSSVEHMASTLSAHGYKRLNAADADPVAKPAATEVKYSVEALSDFLTDEEMAAYLRKSLATIQKMRLRKGLPYLPGRPPLVMKADFFEYLATVKKAEAAAAEIIKPTGAMTDEELVQDARLWVLKRKRRFPRTPRGGS